MAMIQIRNVPDELHRKLKVRAAERGLTLTDFLLHEVERLAAAPTPAEMKARLAALPRPRRLREPPSAEVRRIRDRGE